MGHPAQVCHLCHTGNILTKRKDVYKRQQQHGAIDSYPTLDQMQ